MPQYTLLKRSAAPAAFCIALAIGYNILPPSPATIPYMVPARQDTIPSCVHSTLASVQKNGFQRLQLVPVVDGEGIDGIIVMRAGDPIPDPETVPKRGNVKIEDILYLCEQHKA